MRMPHRVIVDCTGGELELLKADTGSWIGEPPLLIRPSALHAADLCKPERRCYVLLVLPACQAYCVEWNMSAFSSRSTPAIFVALSCI